MDLIVGLKWTEMSLVKMNLIAEWIESCLGCTENNEGLTSNFSKPCEHFQDACHNASLGAL